MKTYLIKRIYRRLFRRMLWLPEDAAVKGMLGEFVTYMDRQTLRSILAPLKISSACEVGCGYGRLTVVLKEFTQKVVGFEREGHLLDIVRPLFPDIKFIKVKSIDNLTGEYDFVMTHTVLQHLTDDYCKRVLAEIKRIAVKYILLTENTDGTREGNDFIDDKVLFKIPRPITLYSEWMKPCRLVSSQKRIKEFHVPKLNNLTYMLFEV